MQITLLGAAGTVTGSKYLVETSQTRFLVDCGMFQGLKHLRLRNWDRPPFDVHALDAVVLTHAHLDHSGMLPGLTDRGFGGPIHASAATADLCRILLLDAAHLQMEDAKRANRRGYSRHRPARALYEVDDAERAIRLFRRHPFHRSFHVGDVEVTLVPAGHILGAASVILRHRGRTVFFSGDVGRPDDILMRPPEPFAGADLLFVESTYGDRLHPETDPRTELAEIVNRVCGRGGVLMIPAFAVGRTQALLHLLAELRVSGAIPRIPTFLNSPMAIDVTEVFCAHDEDHRLDADACRLMCADVTFVHDVEQSKALNEKKGPAIIIAGSGMITGGRILHHLVAFGSDPRNGLLLAGFQAAGSRGAALLGGAEKVKIHGEYVSIEAELFRMEGLSGHADWKELVAWLRTARPPERVVITHGEALASDAFRIHLREELGWEAEVGEDRQVIHL